MKILNLKQLEGSPGGLDLSRHGLNRDSRSRRFSKVDLGMMDILDGFQKLVSTWKTFSTVQKTKSWQGLSSKISIFFEISMETLDLDTFKSWSRHDGHSRRFSKVSLDMKDILNLDLNWSRLSRPPGLLEGFKGFKGNKMQSRPIEIENVLHVETPRVTWRAFHELTTPALKPSIVFVLFWRFFRSTWLTFAKTYPSNLINLKLSLFWFDLISPCFVLICFDLFWLKLFLFCFGVFSGLLLTHRAVLQQERPANHRGVAALPPPNLRQRVNPDCAWSFSILDTCSWGNSKTS